MRICRRESIVQQKVFLIVRTELAIVINKGLRLESPVDPKAQFPGLSFLPELLAFEDPHPMLRAYANHVYNTGWRIAHDAR